MNVEDINIVAEMKEYSQYAIDDEGNPTYLIHNYEGGDLLHYTITLDDDNYDYLMDIPTFEEAKIAKALLVLAITKDDNLEEVYNKLQAKYA